MSFKSLFRQSNLARRKRIKSSAVRDRRLLRFESLEGRQMMDGSSPWTGSANLTLSFAPDGTNVSSLANSLYDKFGQLASRSAWQGAILHAFQTWAVHSNINIGLTGDSGAAFGISGPTQGDRRFGDVRIGAIPLSTDEVAAAVDHDQLLSGTWAGDVLFNADAHFSSLDDLFSVALHEAGHVLGLSHSMDEASPMYAHAISTNLVPTAQDIANLRALYGTRSLDENEGSNGNNSISRATRLRNRGSLHGTIPLVVFGDIHRGTDSDYFLLPPLSNYEGPITFTVRTAGISLLAPRLMVYDEEGVLLKQSASTSTRGSAVSVTIPEAREGETYFARVLPARNDVFGIGSYALIATLDDNLTVPKSKIRAVTQGDYRFLTQDQLQEVFLSEDTPDFNDDAGLNDAPLGATELSTTAGYAAETHYRYEGSIALATEPDFYLLTSPRTGGNVMTVSITALEQRGLIPEVQIRDADLNRLVGEVLVNGNGEYVLQVAGIEAHSDYFVEVKAWNPAGPNATGNYRLDVGFRRTAIVRETFADGSFVGLQREQFHSLYVGQNQLFHFALQASQAATEVMLWATIYNDQGRVVYRVATTPGQLHSKRSVILSSGSYLVQITAATESSDTRLPPINYSLLGLGISGPVGPRVVDANGTPIYSCPDGSGRFCYPGGLVTTRPYVFVDGRLISLPGGSTSQPPLVSIEWWYWYQSWLAATIVAPR